MAHAALKQSFLLLPVGACLGTLHLANVLFPTASHSAIVLPLSIGALAIAISIWRRLGIWSSLLGGFLFGLGYFGVALHWLGSAANHDPATLTTAELWLQAGALCLFVPWWAVWFLGAKLMALRLNTPDFVAIVLCFSVSNLLLSDLLYGMPMAPLSMVVLDTPLSALFGIVGQFGVDTLMVALSAALAVARYKPALAGTALGIGIVGLADRHPGDVQPDDAGSAVYLAQHSLPHPSMMDPATVEQTVHNEVFRLISEGVARGASLIVLPENMLFADLTTDTDLTGEIAALLPDDTHVLVGFTRIEVTPPADGAPKVMPFNSAMLLDRDGPVQVISKAHLVPFGETMPSIFFKMGYDVVAGPSGGYGSADSISTLSLPTGDTSPFAVLICYEAMLSGAVSRETPDAQWLLNISAETGFRGTVGPRLLIDQVRIRAIETGLPILRSTAHAFSGVVAPDGSVTAMLDEEVAGGVLSTVPAAQPTLFRTLGYAPLYVFLLTLTAFCAFRVSGVAIVSLIPMLDYTNKRTKDAYRRNTQYSSERGTGSR